MSHFCALPTELLLIIVTDLEYAQDINAFGRTCRRFHELTEEVLYPRFALDYSPRGVKRIVETDNVAAMRKLLSTNPRLNEEAFHRMRYTSFTPLQMAADMGSAAIFDAYILQNNGIPDWKTLLHSAVQNGHVAIVMILRYLGAPIDPSTLCSAAKLGHLNLTALMCATAAGRPDIMRCLLTAGADAKAKAQFAHSTTKLTALDMAPHQREDVVRCLLDHGAHIPQQQGDPSVTITLSRVATGLMNAIPSLRLMLGTLDLDATIQFSNKFQRKHLLSVAAALGDMDLLNQLLALGVSIRYISSPDSLGVSSLVLAARYGHVAIVNRLLDEDTGKVDRAQLVRNFLDAINEAAEHNHSPLVTELFRRAVNSSELDRLKARALNAVVGKGHGALYRMLVQEDAIGAAFRRNVYKDILTLAIRCNMPVLITDMMDRPHIPFTEREDLLKKAAVLGSPEALQAVLGRRSPNLNNPVHREALMCAVESLNTENARFLLGGAIRSSCFGGGTGVHTMYDFRLLENTTLLNWVAAWDFRDDEATKQKTLAMISMLIDCGAKVNRMDCKKRTALIMTVTNDSGLAIARVLIDRGADPLAGNFRGQNALKMAIKRHKVELVELFVSSNALQRHSRDELTRLVPPPFDELSKGEKRSLLMLCASTERQARWDRFYIIKALKRSL